ncbi:MAG: hypothetical protein Q9180_002495 [Flavoplaca navasiana]
MDKEDVEGFERSQDTDIYGAAVPRIPSGAPTEPHCDHSKGGKKFPTIFLMVIQGTSNRIRVVPTRIDTGSSTNLIRRQSVLAAALNIVDGPSFLSNPAGPPRYLKTFIFLWVSRSVQESFIWYVFDALVLDFWFDSCASTLLEDSPETVEIILFPRDAHGSFAVTADVEKSVPISIISSRIPYRLQQKYEPCEVEETRDAKGRTYDLIGKISLGWHEDDEAVGYDETFYVIDSEVPMVLFGQSGISDNIGS